MTVESREAPPRTVVANGNSAGAATDRGAAPPVETKRSGPSPVVRIVGLVVVAILVVAGLIWGIRTIAFATTHESTDDARVDADTAVVTSKIAERVRDILVDTNQPVTKGQVLVRLEDTDERTRLAAAIAARDALRAQARAAEQTVSLTAAQQSAQGTQGTGGISSAQASIATAQANVANAAQQVAAAQAQTDQAAAQVRVAQDAVPAASSALQKAQADFNRTASLVQTGDVARSQLDAARAALDNARAQYQQAQANVTAARANLNASQQRVTAQQAAQNAAQAAVSASRGQLQTAQGRLAETDTPYRVSAQQAQANAAQAQVESADAQVRQAQDQLNYTVIRSPIDGYVGEKNVNVGQQVQPGTSLLTLVPNNTYITANFKETQLGHIKVGDPVEVSVDAYKGTTFPGKVSAISPASQNTFSLIPPQNASGNFVKVTQRVPVRIVVDNPDPSKYVLRPGMSVVAAVKYK